MATTIITKNGSGAPADGDLSVGELAVDLTNKQLYTKDSNGVIKLGSSADEGQWTLNGDDIYYDDGNVGIGVSDPDAELEVQSAEPTLKISNDVAKTAGEATIGQIEFAQHFGTNSSSSIKGIEIGSSTSYVEGGLTFSTCPSGGSLTERLRIDSDGNVGIGTDDPRTALEVSGSTQRPLTVNSTNTESVVTFTDAGTSSIAHVKAGSKGDDFVVYAGGGGAPKMTIRSNGKVGLGLTDADEVLEVRGDIKTNTGNGAGVLHFGETSDECKITGRDSSHSSQANVLDFFTDGTQRMRLTANGDLCIGNNADPDSKLDVRGTICAGASSPGKGQLALGIQYSGSTNMPNTYGTMKSSAATCIGWGVYGSPTTDNAFVSSVDNTLNFRRGALLLNQNQLQYFNADQQTKNRDEAVTMSERFRVNESGRFLIGATSDNLGGNTCGFLVSTPNVAGAFYRKSSSVNSAAIILHSDVGGAGTRVFQVTANGNVTNVNNSYGAISDERLKSNIVDASSQLDDIMAVQVRSYTLDSTGETHIGVVAQELEASEMSGLVEEGEDGLKTVKYNVLYMKAVKALQEAVTRIETLEAEVAALKGA